MSTNRPPGSDSLSFEIRFPIVLKVFEDVLSNEKLAEYICRSK